MAETTSASSHSASTPAAAGVAVLPGPSDAPHRLEPVVLDASGSPAGKNPARRLISRQSKRLGNRMGNFVKPLVKPFLRRGATPEPASEPVAPAASTSTAVSAKGRERPAPRFAEIQHGLSDGRFVRFSGMVLERALPRADDLSAVASLFAKDEKDVGHLLLTRLSGETPDGGAEPPLEASSSGTDAPSVAPTDPPAMAGATRPTPETPEAPSYAMIVPVETHRGGLFSVAGHVLPRLLPGQYRIQWRNRNGEILPGEGRLRVLPPDYTGAILTSDIDQTYLESDIHSSRGLLKLLREPVRNKHALPGMVTLLQRLQARHPEGLPMVFLSASPTFFAPVFAARLNLHGLGFDGLLLKPFDAVLKRELGRRNVRGALKALKEQLSYKLMALFEQRRLYPVHARELLFGDDTEHDAITFVLYRELLAGRLTLTALADTLLKHGIEWYKLEPLLRAARAMLVHQGDVRPVVDVYIRRHRTHSPEAHEPLVTWHADSTELAVALEHRGELTPEDVSAIRVAQRLDRVR